MSVWHLRAAVASALILLGACGSSFGNSGVPDTRISPAASIAVMQMMNRARPLGALVQYDATMKVGVLAFEVRFRDHAAPYLAAAVRAEATGRDGMMPEIGIQCAGSERGGWYANSTVAFGETVPAGSAIEGTMNLLLPGDKSAAGGTTVHCDPPAVIKVETSGADQVVFAIPLDVLAELNAGARVWNTNHQ